MTTRVRNVARVATAIAIELAAPRAQATETPLASPREVAVTARLYSGFGGGEFTAPDGSASPYRMGLGGAVGVAMARIGLGVDFGYFLGSRLVDATLSDPPSQGDGQYNSYRLVLEASYDFEIAWLVLRPHVQGGAQWTRIQVADATVVDTSPIVVPAFAVLVSVGHGTKIGIDSRLAVIVHDNSTRGNFSGFLTGEYAF